MDSENQKRELEEKLEVSGVQIRDDESEEQEQE